MGKKSRAKKELRAFKQVNVTYHQWNLDGVDYEIQEIHPENSEPSNEETMKQLSLIVRSGHTTFDATMKALLKAFPHRRFYIIAPKEFIVGETPIVIGTYPELTEGQSRRTKEAIESVRRQEGLTT